MEKHLIFWTLAVIALSSCGKINSDGLYPRAYGDEVVFSLSNTSSPLKTKAEYSGDIDDNGIERIDWVEGEKISVACAQTENDFFNYTIASIETHDHESHAQVTHDPGSSGLRWKDDGTYNFYAISPSNSNLIPAGYAVFNLPVAQTQDASASGWDTGHTRFKSAVSPAYMQMTAKQKVTKSGDDPADPVDLPFVMLPTVLEFTLKGEADMVVDAVALKSGSTPLTGSYWVEINEKESEANPDFPKTGYQNDDEHVFKTASIELRDSGEPVELEAGKELTFTFMLLPKDIQGITFYLTRLVSGEPYTVKTELRYSDTYMSGEFLTFDAHKKYLIKGMVVPESVKWEIEGEVIVTPLVTVTSTDDKDYFDPIFE